METALTDPTEREIWATVRALNAAWTRGNPDALERYFHARMIAVTPVDRLRLDGQAACVAGWKGFVAAARVYDWQEIDPAIRVYGEAAVVSYDYDIDYEMSGRRSRDRGRDLMFLVRADDRWQVVGDQFSSMPGA